MPSRPSLVEQGRKWSRRHPSLLAAAVLVMFLTLGRLAGEQLADRQRPTSGPTRRWRESRLRAEEAEKRFQQARQAADLLIEVSEKELADKPPAQGLRKRLSGDGAWAITATSSPSTAATRSSQAELVAVQERLKKILDDLTVLEGAGQLILLADRRVQDDLALDDAQRGEDRGPRQGFRAATVAIRCATSANCPRPSGDRGSWNWPGPTIGVMRATLTPAQLQRLEQITLQLHGPMAFDQPKIVARLGLSDDQRRTIRQIQREAFAPAWNFGEEPHGPRPPPGGRQAVMQGVMEKAQAVLTFAQLAEWRKLTGPAFKDALDFPPPGFPPGGPPPGGPGHHSPPPDGPSPDGPPPDGPG